jgi:ABC-type branched-subunit amino acid transport system substrate-binding protein
MEMDRRHVLDLLRSGLLLSAAPSMVSGQTAPLANAGGAKAALLVPISGASAELGLSMQRATRLAQSGGFEKAAFRTFDTSDTPEAAGAAAATAIAQGASAILGPVFARQMQAVGAADADRRVPVISFSNSAAPPESGIFTFGITPSQSVSAILQYARGRGVRRVALIGTGTAWSEQAKRAAQRLASEIGVETIDAPALVGGADLLQALRVSGIPDAALLTGGPAQFAALASELQINGVQVLGTLQALGATSAGAGLEGVWLSAPDPAAFETFAKSYTRAGGTAPGAIAALAYDAARIVETLSGTGKLNREGFLAAAGFPGVTGAVRFTPDGRCVRELAILAVTSGTMRAVARKAGL